MSWDDFETAFEGEFGDQPPVSMNKLEDKVTNKETNTVNIYDYSSFTCTHGLYQSFQKLVDPGRAVYVLGSVEDEVPLG